MRDVLITAKLHLGETGIGSACRERCNRDFAITVTADFQLGGCHARQAPREDARRIARVLHGAVDREKCTSRRRPVYEHTAVHKKFWFSN